MWCDCIGGTGQLKCTALTALHCTALHSTALHCTAAALPPASLPALGFLKPMANPALPNPPYPSPRQEKEQHIGPLGNVGRFFFGEKKGKHNMGEERPPASC